jgi:hypothetical protein
MMSTKTKTEPPMETLQFRLPVEMLAWIDEFRASLPITPTRSEVIRFLIERGVAAYEQDEEEE